MTHTMLRSSLISTSLRTSSRSNLASGVDQMTHLTVALLILIPAIACTGEALVTVEVTREVEVTLEVEVTREVEVKAAPNPRPICSDYPYMLALGELQLGYFDASVTIAERAVSGTILEAKASRDWFADRIATSRLNQVVICGGDFEPFGSTQREMNSFEGSAVCTNTLDLLDDIYTFNPDWDNAPREAREAWNALAEGYVNYCDNDFTFQQ